MNRTVALWIIAVCLLALCMLYGLSTTSPKPDPPCVDHWDWVERDGEIVLRFETCLEADDGN